LVSAVETKGVILSSLPEKNTPEAVASMICFSQRAAVSCRSHLSEKARLCAWQKTPHCERSPMLPAGNPAP
jgi:hypothetical protein